MQSITRQQVLGSLEAALSMGASTKPPPKGSFTVAEYAKSSGLSRKGASDRLSVLVLAGKLQVTKGVADGKVKNFYYV